MTKFLRKENYRYSVAFLLFLCFSVASCNKKFDEYWNVGAPKGGSLYDRLKKDTTFSLFASAIDRADLSKVLVNGGSFTVFAPTNEAFTKYLVAKGYPSVNDIPAADIERIVNYHIVNNMWYYYDIKERYFNKNNKLYFGDFKQYYTRLRKYVEIDVTSNQFKVNGISVIENLRDIDADNGVIHGVPQVLLPLPNIHEFLSSDPELSQSTFFKLLSVLKYRVIDSKFTMDRNGDGRIDTAYLPFYDLISGGNTFAVEASTSSVDAINVQGGIPVLTTLIIPSNDALNQYIAPALQKVNNNIDSLSPSYIKGVLDNYILRDTVMTAAKIIGRSNNSLRSGNNEVLPDTYLKSTSAFLRSDIKVSNGMIHVVNATTSKLSDREKSALGQASADPDFKLFFSLLEAANLASTYAVTSKAATYLVPSNAAIRAAGLEAKADIKTNKSYLYFLAGSSLSATQFQNLIKHHFLNTNNANKTALTGSKGTEFGLGGSLTFTNSGSTVTNTNMYSATVGNMLYNGTGTTINGYVYKIDKLLIPSVLQ